MQEIFGRVGRTNTVRVIQSSSTFMYLIWYEKNEQERSGTICIKFGVALLPYTNITHAVFLSIY